MPTNSLLRTKSAFNAFRVESVWLRSIYDTSFALYSSGTETETILKKVAPAFFGDLNHILIEYWILVVCRLTDPAISLGRENLTAANLVASLEDLKLMTEEIRIHANGLQKYRSLLNTARNRAVSHADKATFLQPELLGEHQEYQVADFLEDLQKFNDLVGIALGEGPLDFRGTSGPGDAYDLIHFLKNAA
jgi:hypothetical protein